MKNNRGSLTIIAIFTVLLFSLYGVLLYARSASSYIRQSKSIETIQRAYAQDVPNAVQIAKALGATSTYVGEYYTITINADNGSDITSFSIMPGELVSRPAIPEKEGKGFDNWYYINASGVEEVFDFNVAPTGNVDIYAKYTGEAIMMARDTNISFWKDEYREKITSIKFIKSEIPTDTDMLEDIQINGAARIGAYVEDYDGWLALTIVSPNTIYANTEANHYFYNFKNLRSIEFNNFDTSKTNNIHFMFYGCNNLTRLDLSSFNTSNVKRMDEMFRGCSKLGSLNISSFNTNNVTTMSCMFYGCENLTNLDVSKFNTDNVTTMYCMFYNCKKLNDLDVSRFNTTKVTSMSNMFNGCESLTNLDVSGFNTGNVTTMYSMFSNCKRLNSIDLSRFDTSNVTNMQSMFTSCRNLRNLDLSNFNTAKVNNMASMFNNCKGLSSINLSTFNTSNVTNMSSMFNSCGGSEFTIIDVSAFDTTRVQDMSYMFYNCNLVTIYASNAFVTTSVINSNSMFSASTKIKGGNGTVHNSNNVDATYARIDTEETPGYFTLKTN